MGMTKTTYTIPRLIRRSQFVFQTRKQLENFEHNQYKLGQLSKIILSRHFWASLHLDDVKEHGVTEIIQELDYYEYSKGNPVGIGFEALSLNKQNGSTISQARRKIHDYINKGIKDFNAALNLGRSIRSNARRLKYHLAAIIIKRCNNDYYELQKLSKTIDKPTLFTLNEHDLKKLS